MESLVSKTIGMCLQERAEKTPDLEGLSYHDETYTWKDMDVISDFLALQYLDMGISHESHAAVWSVNSPGWVLTYFALMKLGAVAVLINTCYKERELKDILIETDVEYLFYGKGFKQIEYRGILDRIPVSSIPKIKKCLLLDRGAGDRWFRRSDFPKEMTKEDQKRLEAAKKKADPMELACILFTSGTTSRAKGVMLSHYSLVNNARELGRQMHWNESDRICISVPLFHCFGITAGILAGIQSGAVLQLLKYYKTVDVMEQVEKHRCTVLNGVPTMFLAIVRNEKRTGYDLSSLRSGIIAGSPITGSEYRKIYDELHMEKLQASYGQTESSPCITISGFEDVIEQKAESAGKKISQVELRIWNFNENREAAVGEDGEIQTRGYHVMMGYYHRPQETAQVLTSDKWLCTGDSGHLDEEGYLHVTGRMKEMIIRGGENISPLEIEECVSQLEEVGEVKVIGIAAEVLQEEIAACIIPKNGAFIDPEKVQEFVRLRLANYKVPKYILSFQNFPINSSGKIMLGDLKRLADEKIREEEE